MMWAVICVSTLRLKEQPDEVAVTDSHMMVYSTIPISESQMGNAGYHPSFASPNMTVALMSCLITGLNVSYTKELAYAPNAPI
jgi:hypothetical protein